jgi:hypothetical protein
MHMIDRETVKFSLHAEGAATWTSGSRMEKNSYLVITPSAIDGVRKFIWDHPTAIFLTTKMEILKKPEFGAKNKYNYRNKGGEITQVTIQEVQNQYVNVTGSFIFDIPDGEIIGQKFEKSRKQFMYRLSKYVEKDVKDRPFAGSKMASKLNIGNYVKEAKPVDFCYITNLPVYRRSNGSFLYVKATFKDGVWEMGEDTKNDLFKSITNEEVNQ